MNIFQEFVNAKCKAVLKENVTEECPSSHNVPPLQKEGGTQILKSSKRGEPEKKFWVGETKRVERFSKIKGGTQLFMLNLGTAKNKNEDF